MFRKILQSLSNIIRNNFSEENLNNLQDVLVQIELFVKAEDLIAILILFSAILFVMTIALLLALHINVLLSLLSLILPSLGLIFYIFYKVQKRQDRIDEDLPDYLRQVASLLKIGLGLETALNELSNTINSPLNNEIKRALIEIRLGKTFDEALLSIAERNNSENLKHTFQLIIFSRESGGNIADILENIADDLTEILILKKERKSNVMMSVMFLLISSIVATPFAFGMIRLYSEFIGSVGRSNSLLPVIPITSIAFLSINAVLISILLGIVMYSSYKKGLKYILIILPASMMVYYFSQIIFRNMLGV